MGVIRRWSKYHFELKRVQHYPYHRVPIPISAGGSYFAWLFGRNIRDYYTAMDLALEAKLRGLNWVFDKLQND